MTTAYILAQLKIEDRDRYTRYAAQFMRTLVGFDARLLASDEEVAVLGGPWPYEKIVLLEFRDREEATRWLTSPAYREIAVEREASTTATLLSFRGVRPWQGSLATT